MKAKCGRVEEGDSFALEGFYWIGWGRVMWGSCVSVVEGGGGVGVQFFRLEVKWRNLLSLKCALSARTITRCKDEIFRAGCVKCHAHRADFSAHFQGVLWPYAIRQETKQLCSRHDGFTLAGWHRRGGSTAYVMKIHHRETHPFLKRMKERIFPFLFNKTIYNYMIRSN